MPWKTESTSTYKNIHVSFAKCGWLPQTFEIATFWVHSLANSKADKRTGTLYQFKNTSYVWLVKVVVKVFFMLSCTSRGKFAYWICAKNLQNNTLPAKHTPSV